VLRTEHSIRWAPRIPRTKRQYADFQECEARSERDCLLTISHVLQCPIVYQIHPKRRPLNCHRRKKLRLSGRSSKLTHQKLHRKRDAIPVILSDNLRETVLLDCTVSNTNLMSHAANIYLRWTCVKGKLRKNPYQNHCVSTACLPACFLISHIATIIC
jgi:hypothetical protein